MQGGIAISVAQISKHQTPINRYNGLTRNATMYAQECKKNPIKTPENSAK
jgi:hypothetical protein